METQLNYNEVFANSFKYAPIGMAVASKDGKWLEVNEAFCQIMGFVESELLNMTYQDITHPDDLNMSMNVIDQLLGDKLESYQMEKRYIHKSGYMIKALLVLSIVRDERRQPLFFIAQIKETTCSNFAKNELKIKATQLASFIEHNADAIWMMDCEDTILAVNPAFETLFGWSADEIKGEKLPMIPDFLQAAMEQTHQRIKAGETIVGFETIRQRKDGQLLDVEATLSPLRDHDGTILGITGICRDVTARKRAEQELHAKTQQLESFIENNADAIWMINNEGIILEVNPAFETLFGWSAEEIKGKRLPMIPDSLQEAMERTHQRIQEGETIVGFATVRQRKDGQLLDVEATLSPLRDHHGTIIGITGICRDVTARKRATQELRAKTQQLESFIENNADTIIVFNNDCQVQRVNLAFEKVFGWKKEEVLGLDIHNLPIIPAEGIEEMKRRYDKVSQGQSIVGIETVRKRKNGESVFVILTASPTHDSKGNQNGWAVTMRDITGWKMAQEHMNNSEKLSVAGQLAAGIAHEIRNPITSIKGFIQLMKSGFGEKQKYFDIMASEINRIEMILSELLILAKPQSVKYEKKDICVLLHQVITLLDTQAILNNVQFKTEFTPGSAQIYCDENQLKQVFINFIKNAIEAMPKGGEIRIQISNDENQQLRIRLIDEGCGIPKDVLSKLGQPFYTTKEKGTGLGFMVSKKIIENHAGHIHVESEVNQGTKIEITLPVLG
ncbi:PAS domain S-box protein [Paenibacillus aestuarii]|uniref:histidine kinase n=1 Tax=Paenibacillus aestuarii TaxID=516965 RepID=A0ABW0K7A9_9BACL|nr:PAS domain S-box protein [Paenibacillus aestuarii]